MSLRSKKKLACDKDEEVSKYFPLDKPTEIIPTEYAAENDSKTTRSNKRKHNVKKVPSKVKKTADSSQDKVNLLNLKETVKTERGLGDIEDMKLKNQAMRIINKADWDTPITLMLKELDLLTIDESVLLDTMTKIFKIDKELTPQYLKGLKFADCHDYRTRNAELFKGKWQPPNWPEVLSQIRIMRSAKDAPVDSMGCDQCADGSAPESTQRLHHLLSLMLSSQTKDQVTFAAMGRLRAIPGGLSLDTLLAMSEEELGGIIHPVGFWRSKAKYIKATCNLLKTKFDGDIPNTAEGLCSLPGVGPKMAHLCMQSAWGVVSGIGVDTHVHRISNRLGWVRNTNSPEKTRNELESWLPKQLWREVNHLLVGFGQTTCKPVNPNCIDCLANKLCPSAGKTAKKK